MPKLRPVRIFLLGGIGNQLFQYFAGLYLAKKIGVELILDGSRIGVHGTLHKSSLTNINIPHEIRYSNMTRFFYQSIFGRAHGYLLRNLTIYGTITAKLFGTYQSQLIGFDAKVFNSNKALRLNGYFQSPKYFNALSEKDREISLRESSSWYRDMQERFVSGKILSLHLRRGDYLHLKSTFGVLSEAYYLETISSAIKEAEYSEICIFSDDLESSRRISKIINFELVTVIEPPQNSNPEESLFLMSQSHGLIISNSTFAWWAAILGRVENVHVPAVWFRNEGYSSDLIRPNWIAHQPIWEL